MISAAVKSFSAILISRKLLPQIAPNTTSLDHHPHGELARGVVGKAGTAPVSTTQCFNSSKYLLPHPFRKYKDWSVNLDQLKSVDAVARHGSVAAAAASLHLTPSAVSQQITKLDREVGHRLLARHGRGVRLTDTGMLLADHARELLSRVERARADIDAASGTVRGHVTIGVFASAARGIMPQALTALSATPELTVELRELEVDDSLPLLLGGELDMAVIIDWDNEPLALPSGLDAVPLGGDVFDVVIACSHPSATGSAVDLRALGDTPWVAWTKDSLCYRWLVSTLREVGAEPDIAHTAEEHATQVALVDAGFGAALLPRIGRPALPAGLVALEVTPALRRNLYAVYRHDSASRPAIAATVDVLRAATQTAAAPTPAANS